MKGMRQIRVGLLILLGIGVVACAADGTLKQSAMTAPYPPPGYAHTVSAHVALYWNCSTPESGRLQVEGVAVNPWSDQPIKLLQFDLVGVDGRDRVVSEAKADARDIQIFTNQSSPFGLDLKTGGSEVRYDLFYQYRFQEGDHGAWMARVSTGPFLLAQQTNRFMVRDACSETQHRVR